MSGFEYSALDAGGREKHGVIEADTERHARTLLRERGLAPLAVESIRDAAGHASVRGRGCRARTSRWSRGSSPRWNAPASPSRNA
jgi:type II secretory pathway component PulF